MRLIFSFIFLFCFHGCVMAQNPEYKASIDSFLTYLKKENAFSGRVTLQKFDKEIYSGNYSLFSKGTNAYKVGSVTKVFTAMIVYQLMDEKQLSADTKLSKFFPGIRNADEITIANLLSHTSGIYNVTTVDDYYASRAKYYSRSDIVDLINRHSPAFKPNADQSYSNSNYILLGFIIEDVTKKSYEENVQERFQQKMKLTGTYCETSGKKYPARESSYLFNGEEWKEDVDSDPSLPFAAGAMVSTTEDLCSMMFQLAYKNCLSDSSFSMMKRLRGKRMGHGLFKAPFFDKTGWGHNGRIDEFRSFVLYFPEDSLILALTSNGMRVDLNQVVLGVLSCYYGKKQAYPVIPKAVAIGPPTNLFTGVYKAKVFRFITVAKLRITEAGKDHLYMSQALGPNETEKGLLVRKSEYVFYSEQAGGDLEFRLNKKGKVKGFIIQQGKIKIRCKKIKRQ